MTRKGLPVEAVCRSCHGFDMVQSLCCLGYQQTSLAIMAVWRGCQMLRASHCWKSDYIRCMTACNFLEVSKMSKIYSLLIRISHDVDYHHR